jgi:hypothetical protein
MTYAKTGLSLLVKAVSTAWMAVVKLAKQERIYGVF